MRAAFSSGHITLAFRCSVMLAALCCASGHADTIITNVQQLHRLPPGASHQSFSIHLEGDIWWANPSQGRLVLRDVSGAAELELLPLENGVRSGSRVRIEGNGTISKTGERFQLGSPGPVVDNNGLHGMIEKSGAVFLTAGKQPLRLEWFNGVERSGLALEYEGPGMQRQTIPDPALFRLQPDATGGSKFVNGLNYRSCEVTGEVLPDFSRLREFESGVAENFYVALAHRREHVGLVFSGHLEVSRDGLYVFYLQSDDGSRLFVGEPSLQVAVIGQGTFPEPRQIGIGQTLREDEQAQWAAVEGKVTFVRREPGGVYLELSAGAGRLSAEVVSDDGWLPEQLLDQRVRIEGFCQGAHTTDGQIVPGVLLVPSPAQIEIPEQFTALETVAGTSGGKPLLTTATEVHRLKREEAEQGFPVRLRGVVTSVLPEHQAVTIQDSTRGIYVVDVSTTSAHRELGEFLEIEGTTDPSLFAPIVNARRVTSLGAGHLPNPVRPTWDQLMNGSLDAQYVEIQGIITAVQTNIATMLVRGGVIKCELRVIGVPDEKLARYEDALVRVRGSLFASWDYLTHQVKMGEVRIYDADLFVEQPAPEDLFSTPGKTAAELRLFDPQASVFQRVRVSGQIVYVRETECFMMQDGRGVRFIPKQPVALEVGDEVDVVGFPEFPGSGSTVLREAVARKTGHSELPPPKQLPADELVNSDHDSTLVQVEGLLANVRSTPGSLILEMQSGVRSFVARLDGTDEHVRSLTPGSKVALTGVYSGQGGNRSTGQDIASFELLLLSPAGINVLARPPWWTLERLLIIVGALACVLLAALLWIKQLHRQVEERSSQLAGQIRERQRIEQQRVLEQERSRVAQDLHDDLGAGLTEISVLGKQARSQAVGGEQRSEYLKQMDEKARQMVGALDEIVWAMSPSQDSLASLVSYFCLHADRFLGVANIAWELEGAEGLPDVPVNSISRHELFLAFKEALTNVVRHSGATEVRLKIQLQNGDLRLSIADNGRGLEAATPPIHSDGLANMRSRMEKLGGRFEFSSKPGRGTVLNFYMPTNN